MVYTPRFFSSKCSLFHNSNVFGSCIIHILYTGCAKIKKKFRCQKDNFTVPVVYCGSMPCCVVLSRVSIYEIPRTVLNQEVHYRPDKTQILFHILYQINPKPYLAFSFLKYVVIFSLNSNLDFQIFFKLKGFILKNFCPCFFPAP